MPAIATKATVQAESSLAVRLRATVFLTQTLKQLEQYRETLPQGVYREMVKELATPHTQIEMGDYFSDPANNPHTGHNRRCCCKDCYCAAMELRAFDEIQFADEA